MLKAIILVGIGGGVGSVLRYLTSAFVMRFFHATYPYGTLAVNIIGCFLIGLLMGIVHKQGGAANDMRLLLVAGLCGGYTTFSAFAYENITLIQSGQWFAATAYTVASVIGGLLAVGAGLLITAK
jgi:CrcB protein